MRVTFCKERKMAIVLENISNPPSPSTHRIFLTSLPFLMFSGFSKCYPTLSSEMPNFSLLVNCRTKFKAQSTNKNRVNVRRPFLAFNIFTLPIKHLVPQTPLPPPPINCTTTATNSHPKKNRGQCFCKIFG